MEYIRVQSLDDPRFAALHRLMSRIFPPEEVLAFDLWKEPLADPGIHVYVAVHEGEVVGATEYRYYPELRVAMTDFTIIGLPGLGIGRFLYVRREAHLRELERASGAESLGMFAEIYDPLQQVTADLPFGGVAPMHPAVRREVLSHLGYRRLDLDYVHPSWDLEGKAVRGLHLGFRPASDETEQVDASLVVRFLLTYYAAIANKPREWTEMLEQLERRSTVRLLPL